MKADDFKALISYWADVMKENRDYLIDLDSVVGDGDLGLTMSDGFLAASDAIKESGETDIGKLSYFAGKAMSTAVPSTMGTLMASGFMTAGKVLKGLSELDLGGIAEFFIAYLEGVKSRGKAEVGDKTFLDGLYPAAESLLADAASNTDLLTAASKAAFAAHEAFLSTKGMLAKHGRAAARGEKSREILDPGAAVADLMMKGYADFVTKR
jgi:dihydroxyacetone kinase-like protein